MSTFDYSPIISGAIVVALDKFALGEQNMTRSAYLGAAAVGGIYAGQMLAPSYGSLLYRPSIFYPLQ